MKTYTPKEVMRMRQRGHWFYGLVREGREYVIAEIYPGLGYAPQKTYRSKREVAMMLKDLSK